MNKAVDKKYLSVVKEERSLLEKVLVVFPGYRGYREKEILRETDKLIRDTLFKDLRNIKEKLQEAYRFLISSGNSNAKEVEKLLMRIDTIAERIRHATYGYAPLMNVKQVNEKQILRLMSFDAKIAINIEKLRGNVDELKNNISEEQISKFLAGVGNSLSELGESFSRRKECMMELGE